MQRKVDVYVKSSRPKGPDGLGEKWTEGGVSPTLNLFDLTSSVRAVTLVVETMKGNNDNANH